MRAANFLKWSGVALTGALIGVAVTSHFMGLRYPPPDRPANIPATAQWAGGADGGVWVACKPSGIEAHCEIYAESSGVLIEEGDFTADLSKAKPQYYSGGVVTFGSVPLDRNVR